ncbi:MAG TPA: amidophosphoribosyltransferase, partial [Phycicoccus sp.]|nr:amidophosphoribosyltransferase [Phycicoccus sp.]
DRLCTACFTGDYPVALPEDGRLGKGVLELELPLEGAPEGRAVGERHPQRGNHLLDVPLLDVEGVSTAASGGASEALLRP